MYQNVKDTASGPKIEFAPKEITDHRIAQDAVLNQLYSLAGLNKETVTTTVTSEKGTVVTTKQIDPALTAAEWNRVSLAGMDYADLTCEKYMHTLFRLHRDKQTLMTEGSLLGTAAAGVMAATKSAAKDVALVAIAFGLANSTIDNFTSNVLYSLEPSSVRTIVRTLHTEYRRAAARQLPMNRTETVTVIRNYAALCVPANIEAEVNLAVKNARPQTTVPPVGQAPSVTNGPKGLDANEDKYAEILRNFIAQPNAEYSANAQRQVEAFIAAQKLALTLEDFLKKPEAAESRKKAVKDILNMD